MHEYLASPSQANDIVHSVSAAHSAFPELSKDCVVIGHSQGGVLSGRSLKRLRQAQYPDTSAPSRSPRTQIS